MPFIGNKPSAVPLTSADITDGIITSAKIADGTIVNADIGSSAAVALSKLSTTGTASSSTYLRGDGAWTAVSSDFVRLASTGAGSAVSSADLNGYFSSSYDIYEIFIVNLTSSSDQTLKLRFATTGSYTVQTGSDYNTRQNYNSGSNLSYNDYNSTSAYQLVHIGSSTNLYTTARIVLFNPNSSKRKNIHAFCLGNYSGNAYFVNSAGYWNQTTAVTGVRILPDSGTITYDNIYLYGIKNS
jgi:hypothetical protein